MSKEKFSFDLIRKTGNSRLGKINTSRGQIINVGFGGGTPTTEGTGIVVLAQSSTTVSDGNDYTRVLTFGEATRAGTLFVRVGWSVSGGTDATSDSTRKFKYIYKI